MAHYATTIVSPLTQAEAFARMADVRNFVEWDPGIKTVEQVVGDGPGLGTEYELAVKGIGGDIDMRYVVTAYEEPDVIELESTTKLLSASDKITVEATETGCQVTYSADLELRGPLDLADSVLDKAFQKIGDKAAAGMRVFLEAEPAPESKPPAR